MSEPEFDCEAGVPLLHITVFGKRQTWVQRLTWTAERPTVPGTWHIKEPSGLRRIERMNQRTIDDFLSYDASKFVGWLFAGPIPEPAEPTE